MNTKINYMYRDGSNYKQLETVVFEGEITDNEKTQIKEALEEGQYFIPSQVGLEDLQERMGDRGAAFPTEDDHVWHELNIEDISLGDDEPTETFDIHELVKEFKSITWDIQKAMKENGLL